MRVEYAEYAVIEIRDRIREIAKDVFIGKPNTRENRANLKYFVDREIRKVLLNVGIRYDLISSHVVGKKNNIDICFVNNKTGEMYKTLEELEMFFKKI